MYQQNLIYENEFGIFYLFDIVEFIGLVFITGVCYYPTRVLGKMSTKLDKFLLFTSFTIRVLVDFRKELD